MSKELLLAFALVLVPVVTLAEPGPMHRACIADVKALCGSVQAGGGRIRSCMKDHRAELSVGCKVAIADRMLEHKAGPRSATPAAGAPPATD